MFDQVKVFPIETIHIGKAKNHKFFVCFALDPSSFHSLNKYLFSTYNVSDTVSSAKIYK